MARMTPRRWAVALFCSLAANVLLLGVFVTAYVNRERDTASRMMIYTVPWASRVIGDDVSASARSVYRKYQAAMSNKRQALQQDYEAVNNVLSAPQFDRVRFNDALARLRTTTTAAQATMHEAMTDFAAELTADQRRELMLRVNEWAEQREQRALRRAQELEKQERRETRK